MSDDAILLGKGENTVELLPKYGNRHGLVAGATGTGKTVSLMVMAEGFSRIGVPVFMADVKGDIAGLCQPGSPHPKIDERLQHIGITDWKPEANPVVFWDLYARLGHPVRTTVSEVGPTLLTRILELNDTQAGVLDIAFKLADDQGMLLLDLADLRALLNHVAEQRKLISKTYGLVSPASIGAIQRALLRLEQDGGDAFFGPSGSSPVMGNYHWHTILHEIGHSLGLKHGQDTSVYGAMPSSIDSMEYSVMTYRSYVGDPLVGGYSNETYGYAQTYMMYDIAALQYMYGADFTVNSGNTVYSWTPGSGNTLINGNAAITPGANRIFMTIWDGGGIDTYDASAYTTGVSINLAPGSYSLLSTGQRAYLGDGNYARGNVFNALQYGGDARSLIENATGGSGNDTLYGNAANNVLTGNAGNDYLWSSTGNDTLNGGDGNDTLYGAEGNDYNLGGAGDDYIWAYTGADTAYGGDGNDTIYGGADNDWLVGDADNDYVSGDAGNDVVFGGTGVDTLYGGAGNDSLYAGEGNTIDAINDGGDGVDLLYYGYFGLNGYTFDHEANEIRNGATVLGTMAGIEILYGGYGNDIIISDGGGHTYYGLGGNDTLVAGIGAETMYGGTGIDTLDLRLWNGAYVLDMTTGSSNYGGELYLEFEAVLLGNGNDNVSGTVGADTINGGGGNDTMAGLGGDDVYYVDSANDVVVEAAAAGTDWIYSSVNLKLGANVENLILISGARNGTGNGLANLIQGNAQDNKLNGGAGADTLRGFAGNDIYIIDALDTVLENPGGGIDTVRANFNYTLGANLENLMGAHAMRNIAYGLVPFGGCAIVDRCHRP